MDKIFYFIKIKNSLRHNISDKLGIKENIIFLS